MTEEEGRQTYWFLRTFLEKDYSAQAIGGMMFRVHFEGCDAPETDDLTDCHCEFATVVKYFGL